MKHHSFQIHNVPSYRLLEGTFEEPELEEMFISTKKTIRKNENKTKFDHTLKGYNL